MRVVGHYPTPVQGISTNAPRVRKVGQGGLQENLRSDPATKLTRRPPVKWEARLAAVPAGVTLKNHTYRRDGKIYRILILSSGIVYGYVDDIERPVIGNLLGYTGTDLKLQSIEHDTYVVSPTKVVELLPQTDKATLQLVTHVNITAALNYDETITLSYKDGHGLTGTVLYKSDDVGDQAKADKTRATSAVAKGLATALNNVVGISATSLGSSVALWSETSADYTVSVSVATGQGDRSVTCVNEVIENIDGLPLYAVMDTRVRVRPNPISDKGNYYLKAAAVNKDSKPAAVPAGRELEEVVWSEARSVDEPFSFNPQTMPHIVSYDPVTDKFTAGELKWDERRTGDNKSCPAPEFVGSAIVDINFMQQRLTVLADNQVFMTETDEPTNWWKASAVQLLTSDPIGVKSNATGIDKLQHMLHHNRDLLIISANAQFKINGATALTPETSAMPLTAQYACQTHVAPVGLGNSVFLPISHGSSSGLAEYTGEQNTSQDVATPLTRHIIGYMAGTCTMLTASSNLEMIIMKTTESAANEVFVYEQFSENQKRTQQAWSKWVIAGTTNIVDLDLYSNKLVITCIEHGYVVIKTVDMYPYASFNPTEVYLDERIEVVAVAGKTVTVPDGYVVDGNTVVVRGEGALYPMFKAGFTAAGQVLTMKEALTKGNDCKVFIGQLFKSRYRPTRPYVWDEGGVAITHDALRVGTITVSVVDTADIDFEIITPHYDWEVQEYNSRRLNAFNNTLGTQPYTTDEVTFSYAQEAGQADYELRCDGWLSMTIAGISWSGQYHKTRGSI